MRRTTLRDRFTIRTRRARQPIRDEERVLAERILARLIARAYAANHPELLRSREHSWSTEHE